MPTEPSTTPTRAPGQDLGQREHRDRSTDGIPVHFGIERYEPGQAQREAASGAERFFMQGGFINGAEVNARFDARRQFLRVHRNQRDQEEGGSHRCDCESRPDGACHGNVRMKSF